MKKFEETGSVHNKPPSGRPKTARSAENIAAVLESNANDPSTSTPRGSQELGIAQTSLWRILHKDLHLHAYKIQLTQELKERDHLQCRNFVNWMLEQRATDPQFSHKIIFSDEAHFTLNGNVNKQNCRIWGEEKILELFTNNPFMHKNVRFGVVCGLKESSAHFSLKIIMAMLPR